MIKNSLRKGGEMLFPQKIRIPRTTAKSLALIMLAATAVIAAAAVEYFYASPTAYHLAKGDFETYRSITLLPVILSLLVALVFYGCQGCLVLDVTGAIFMGASVGCLVGATLASQVLPDLAHLTPAASWAAVAFPIPVVYNFSRW